MRVNTGAEIMPDTTALLISLAIAVGIADLIGTFACCIMSGIADEKEGKENYDFNDKGCESTNSKENTENKEADSTSERESKEKT